MRPTSPLPASGLLVGLCVEIRYDFSLIQVDETTTTIVIQYKLSFAGNTKNCWTTLLDTFSVLLVIVHLVIIPLTTRFVFVLLS